MKKKNVVVELILPDGSMCMYVGEVYAHSARTIVLTNASWIACTGRRHLFFAGTPDSGIEVEPYPDGVKVEIPLAFVIITMWPHPLPRDAR